MARIVVAASPLSGHVLPMVLIGAQLQSCGHDVTMLTGTAHRRMVERAGLRYEMLGAAGCPVPTSMSGLHRVLPHLVRRYLYGKADIRATFITPLVAQHLALARVLDTEQADVVLVDLAFTGALPLVASPDRRPAVLVCGVGPLTLSSADTAPFGMSWIPRRGMDYGDMHSVVHHVLFRDIQKELNVALDTAGAPNIAVPLMDWPRLADRLFQLTVPEFEYPRSDLPENVEFVGPALPNAADDFEPPHWWDEVIGARTVVHVTQGTHDNGDLSHLIGPTIAALADQAGVVVVATTGATESRLPRTIPANAYLAEWIPYSFLLPHVDVMITNGGYGGVHQAMSHGIPLVVAGETADKAEVAARVEHSGVGVNLGTARPTQQAIIAGVRAAEGHRDAARRLGREIARSTPLDTIAALVDDELAARAGAHT